jgi:hypothetical protein
MKQIIVHRSDLGITGTGFMPFPAQGAPTSAEVHVESVWMVDGTFRNLRVEIDTAPGGGKSWVFVVRINGVDSAMTVTIADSATVGTDTSNDIAVSEGDVLTLKCTGSGTPAVSVIHKIAVEFEGDNAGESGYNGTPASVNQSTAMKAGVFWDTHTSSSRDTFNTTHTAAQVGNIVPTPGDITGYAFHLNQSAGGGTKGYQLYFYKALAASPNTYVKQDGAGSTVNTGLLIDGSNEGVTKTITASFTLPVARGDRVYIDITPLNTPTLGLKAGLATRFVADTDGESIVGGWEATAASNTGVRYNVQHGIGAAWPSTETVAALANNGVSAFTLTKFHVGMENVPGAGKHWIADVRLSGATPGGTLSVTIADTTSPPTGADLSRSVAVAATDTFNIRLSPTNTPAAAGLMTWSAVMNAVAVPTRRVTIFGDNGSTPAGSTRTVLMNLDGTTRTIAQADNSLYVAGYFVLHEQSAAPTPIPNAAILYTKDTGGKTELLVMFPTGAAQQIKIEP